MTPQTVHWLVQELQHRRALLTAEETWAQRQEQTEMRAELFRRIIFRRYMLRVEELVIAQIGDVRGDNPRDQFWRSVSAVAEHQLATVARR